jgi:hypothetical protein
VNCKDFQEIITGAVDGELSSYERQLLTAHLEGCPECRTELRAETALKSFVRSRMRFQPAPSEVVRHVMEIPLQDSTSRLGDFADRVRGFAVRPFVRPAFALALTAIAVFILTSNSGPKDVMQQSVANYESVVNNTFPLQLASAEPAIVRSFFEGKAGFPVIVPDMEDCTLLGGVLDKHPDGAFAHVVYDHHKMKIYLYQVSWDDVVRGDDLTLSGDIRGELMKTNCSTRVTEAGQTIVLWKKGPTLCSAVSNMSAADLISCLTSGDPTIMNQ